MCVLLAEDEWVTGMAAETALQMAGYNVLTAIHGQEALDHIEANPGYFTCLVTDFHMPGGVTGAHVIEHFRSVCPIIPIVLTTAITHVVTEGWRLQHAVDLLPKPYEVVDLVRLVRRLLNEQ